MSAYLSDLARGATERFGSDWSSGPVTLVVLGTICVVLLARELSRGALAGEREARVRTAAIAVVPLVLCAALALGARFLELGT